MTLAINCRRTLFNARNFLYYSEDGLLSGKMAAATVQGAGEEGIVCSLKYFALMKENLQEEIGEKMYDISSS